MSGAGLMCRIIEMYHFILRDLLCSYSLASDCDIYHYSFFSRAISKNGVSPQIISSHLFLAS